MATKEHRDLFETIKQIKKIESQTGIHDPEQLIKCLPSDLIKDIESHSVITKLIFSLVDEAKRLRKLPNKELVFECLEKEVADSLIVQEMMYRLYPEWLDDEKSGNG